MRAAACILLAALLLAGCAHRPGLGSWLDAGTTYAALASGEFAEANPVLSWAPTPAATALASLAVKQAAKQSITWMGVSPSTAHHSIETAGSAAAGWNLALLAGAGTVVGVGAAALAGFGYVWLFAP